MNCTRCKSSMGQTRQETTGTCEQTWYQCPVCGQEQFVTRRVIPASPVQFSGVAGERVTRAWAGRG